MHTHTHANLRGNGAGHLRHSTSTVVLTEALYDTLYNFSRRNIPNWIHIPNVLCLRSHLIPLISHYVFVGHRPTETNRQHPKQYRFKCKMRYRRQTGPIKKPPGHDYSIFRLNCLDAFRDVNHQHIQFYFSDHTYAGCR